ncbi:MAG: TolC family protein [Acidobacteria bacterium]|nr:TolC family protein [Acidobacteriota bacterium]
MRFRRLLLTASVAALATPVFAQEALPLEQAVAEAVARNSGLEAARSGAREASARVDEARSRFFPRVSVSESWQRGNAPVFVFSSLLSARRFAAGNFAIDALNRPDPVGFFHGAIAVEQVLFDGGRTGAGLSAAKGMEAIATAGADEQALALAAQVAAAYGRVLTADAARSAAEAAAKAAAEDVARAERRRDAGTVTNADVLSLQVHLAAMQQQAIEAGGHAAVARAELNRLRGAAVDAAFTVQEPALAAPVTRDWSALAAEAIANRPELKRGEGGVALAESGRRQAKSAWWPQVAAQAAYQYDGLSFSDRASSWVVGGEARWSFSTGMGERAAMRAAAAAEERARASRDEARAAVQVEVLSAVRQLESAEARERVARATVAQAMESQRIIRDRYEAGMAGVQDVLSASAAVLSAETSRTAAVVDRIVAQAALDRALGRRP